MAFTRSQEEEEALRALREAETRGFVDYVRRQLQVKAEEYLSIATGAATLAQKRRILEEAATQLSQYATVVCSLLFRSIAFLAVRDRCAQQELFI